MVGFFRPGFREAPVREGDIIDVTIESVGGKGDGIARVSGFVIFVPATKQGDRVKIKVTRVLRKFAFGELAEGKAAEVKEAVEEKEEAEVKEVSEKKSEKKGRKKAKPEPEKEKAPKSEVYDEVSYEDSEEF